MKQKTINKRLVIVGDWKCGKTSLIKTFQTGEFSDCFRPEPADEKRYLPEVVYDSNKPAVRFDPCDVWPIGHTIRQIIYSYCDVVLLCFALDSHDSLQTVAKVWHPEILQYTTRSIPYILVGMKKDLVEKREVGVPYSEGEAMAQYIGASAYIECSARTNEGLEEVFQLAAREASRPVRRPPGCSIS